MWDQSVSVCRLDWPTRGLYATCWRALAAARGARSAARSACSPRHVFRSRPAPPGGDVGIWRLAPRATGVPRVGATPGGGAGVAALAQLNRPRASFVVRGALWRTATADASVEQRSRGPALVQSAAATAAREGCNRWRTYVSLKDRYSEAVVRADYIHIHYSSATQSELSFRWAPARRSSNNCFQG